MPGTGPGTTRLRSGRNLLGRDEARRGGRELWLGNGRVRGGELGPSWPLEQEAERRALHRGEEEQRGGGGNKGDDERDDPEIKSGSEFEQYGPRRRHRQEESEIDHDRVLAGMAQGLEPSRTWTAASRP